MNVCLFCGEGEVDSLIVIVSNFYVLTFTVAVRKVDVFCPRLQWTSFSKSTVFFFFFFSRVLRDSMSHFSVGPSVRRSVGPSVTKLFKGRFTQNKDILYGFECF